MTGTGRSRPGASGDDDRWMERAIGLGRRGLGRTFPNLPVGAVFVRRGRVLGEGFHTRAGAPHAEIEALRAARGDLRGATLYVTLEPCTHVGRTPPCVNALLGLGLARVVVGTTDPNPRVRGRGVARLRAAGIAVRTGVGAAACAELIAGYRMRLARGRPLVTLKLAASLDGRIATGGGDARWLTGAAARRIGHGLRSVHDAVLVGAETVRRDDPRLTARIRGGHDPIRIVLSGTTVDLPSRAQLLRGGGAPTWVVVPRGARREACDALARRGVEVITLAGRRGRIPLAAVMDALGARGLTSVLVEGGGVVAGAALRAGVVDRLVLFLAPRLLGSDARAAVGPLGCRQVRDALTVGSLAVSRVGPDLAVTAVVHRPRGRR